jgi:hypothetical protein
MEEVVTEFLKGRRGKFLPGSIDAHELSRTKVELFLRCQRCFWLDRRHGIAPPLSPPYTLNSAVDELLKREFDTFRSTNEVHPLLKRHGLLLRPAQRPELSLWRNNFKGVRVFDQGTNLILYGSIDDLWIDDLGTYYVADYKATSKAGGVGLDADWQISYKRQVEFYQWLLRRNGLSVSDQAWFVYANGKKDRPFFDDTLHFATSLIPYKGNTDWVEPTLDKIARILNEPQAPAADAVCQVCAFVEHANNTTRIRDGAD